MIIRAANRVITIMVLTGALLGVQEVTAEQSPAPRARWSQLGQRWTPPGAGQKQNSPDTPGTGAYPAMKEEIPALPPHVVYRPRELGGDGVRRSSGVVAWGKRRLFGRCG